MSAERRSADALSALSRIRILLDLAPLSDGLTEAERDETVEAVREETRRRRQLEARVELQRIEFDAAIRDALAQVRELRGIMVARGYMPAQEQAEVEVQP
jgi:hypothetical protein